MSSVAVVVRLKPKDPDEDSALTEGEESEERRAVEPLELLILVKASMFCLLKVSKVMEPLFVETVRLRASTFATEIGEDSVWITTSLALSMDWMKIGRLRVLSSRFPTVRGREMVMSIMRRGAERYESRERPPVEMVMFSSC